MRNPSLIDLKSKSVNYSIMKILIVDDHELFAEGLKLLLDSMDGSLEVEFVTQYSQFIKESRYQSFDLIFLDYNLADVDGIEAIHFIREHSPKVSIIVISSEDSPKIIQSTIESGASGFIPKSSPWKILVAALELVLNGGIYLPMQAINESARLTKEKKFSEEEHLTDRQKEVLKLAIRGISNKAIALDLGIAEGTVKAHLSTAYKALGVRNRVEAVNAMARAH